MDVYIFIRFIPTACITLVMAGGFLENLLGSRFRNVNEQQLYTHFLIATFPQPRLHIHTHQLPAQQFGDSYFFRSGYIAVFVSSVYLCSWDQKREIRGKEEAFWKSWTQKSILRCWPNFARGGQSAWEKNPWCGDKKSQNVFGATFFFSLTESRRRRRSGLWLSSLLQEVANAVARLEEKNALIKSTITLFLFQPLKQQLKLYAGLFQWSSLFILYFEEGMLGLIEYNKKRIFYQCFQSYNIYLWTPVANVLLLDLRHDSLLLDLIQDILGHNLNVGSLGRLDEGTKLLDGIWKEKERINMNSRFEFTYRKFRVTSFI